MTQRVAERTFSPVPWIPTRRTDYCFGLRVLREGVEWTDTSHRIHFLLHLPEGPADYPNYVIWKWDAETEESVFWAFPDEALALCAFRMSDEDRDIGAEYHVEIGMHTPWFMAYAPDQVRGEVALLDEPYEF